MASKVGLVLALDGEKQFSKDLRSASETVKLAKSALSSVDEKYRGSANSLAALTEKSKALATAQSAMKSKMDAANAGLTKSNQNYDNISTKLSNVRTRMDSLRTSLDNAKSKYGENSIQAKLYGDALAKLETTEKGLEHEQDRQQKSVLKWQTAVNKATAELNRCNKEVDKNEQYLNEAKDSSDHCATSIDRFGKEVKDAGKDAKNAGNDVKSFGEMIGERLSAQMLKQKAFDTVCGALKRVGQAAVAAVKDMVKVGMEFDAQMSRVKAISGADSGQMQKLTDKAKQLGSTTVYTATESAAAMEQLALAGWRTESIIDGIDGVLSLASSSSMDLASAATYVSDNLNAYGLSADKAGELSDVMAYAMSNASMTTEDLGEAYGKVAATAASYGYNYKEVTAVLMGMANAGRKGGEAGTSLNTIMTRLSTNTSKCSDAIKQYNGGVDIMYDSSGKMRPLTDVLSDLYDVWVDLDDAERNALAKQIAGVRQGNALFAVMAAMEPAVGSTTRSFAEYADELENCEGAAKRMAGVSLDNLAGDVELMNDAFAGLKIELEGKLDKRLRDAVGGITNFINSITDAISDQRSEMDQFIADIQTQNEEVNALLDQSNNTITGAEVDVAEMEAYRDLLKSVNGEEEMSAFQKYQVKNAVEKLSGAIPELTKAFDETRGVLKLTDTELDNLFDDAERNAIQTAFLSAMSDDYEALAKAKVSVAMATSAEINAGKDYQTTMDAYLEAEAKHEGALGDLDIQMQNLAETWDDSKKALEDSEAAEAEAQKTVDAHREAYAAYAEEMGWAIKTTDELSESGEVVEGAMTDVDEAVEDTEESLEDLEAAEEAAAQAAQENAQKMVDAYESVKNGLETSINGMISLKDKWSQSDPIEGGGATIVDNLQSQIDGLQAWKDNMITLADQVGNGLSQELYDKLVEMGPESAGLIQDLVNSMSEAATDGESANMLEQISKKWSEAMTLSENVDAIADATTAGQDMANAYSEGILTELGESSETVKSYIRAQAMEAFSDAQNPARDAGPLTAKEYTDALAKGIIDGKTPVSRAAKTLSNDAVTGLGSMSGSTSAKGEDFAAGYAQGIRNGTGGAVNAAIEMVSRALAAVKSQQKSNSPSKETAKLGTDFGDGYVLAIEGSSAKAVNAAEKLAAAALNTLSGVGFSTKQVNAINKKLSNAFNVSWYTGSGKKKKKKDVETYYSDVMKAAKKYADNKKTIDDWSLRQEEMYWEKVLQKLKSGTQAWNDAKKQIIKLKESIEKENASNQKKILDYYKTYNPVSLKAEMQYWANARLQFAKGTDLRIEADKKYLDTKDAYYDALIDLEEDYRGRYMEIEENLQETVDNLTQTYKDSVTSRKDEILSAMNLFDEFTSEGFKPKKLIKNLETQVEALELWESKLHELKERGISQDLYSILQAEGPEGVANVYSISQMTDEELAAYEELLKRKTQLATQQALKDNEFLLSDTNRQIEEANKAAADALADLERQYSESLAAIGENAPAELLKMLSESGITPADAVAAMFKQYEAIKSSDNKIESLVTDVADRLQAIVPATENVGKMALDSFLDALTDDASISAGAHRLVSEIQDAVAYAGKDLTVLDSKLKTDISKIGTSGTAMLNDLTGLYNPQTVVNVDNTSVSATMNQFLEAFNTMMTSLINMKVVLDTGETVGALSDQINASLGSSYASDNRGTLR